MVAFWLNRCAHVEREPVSVIPPFRRAQRPGRPVRFANSTGRCVTDTAHARHERNDQQERDMRCGFTDVTHANLPSTRDRREHPAPSRAECLARGRLSVATRTGRAAGEEMEQAVDESEPVKVSRVAKSEDPADSTVAADEPARAGSPARMSTDTCTASEPDPAATLERRDVIAYFTSRRLTTSARTTEIARNAAKIPICRGALRSRRSRPVRTRGVAAPTLREPSSRPRSAAYNAHESARPMRSPEMPRRRIRPSVRPLVEHQQPRKSGGEHPGIHKSGSATSTTPDHQPRDPLIRSSTLGRAVDDEAHAPAELRSSGGSRSWLLPGAVPEARSSDRRFSSARRAGARSALYVRERPGMSTRHQVATSMRAR